MESVNVTKRDGEVGWNKNDFSLLVTPDREETMEEISFLQKVFFLLHLISLDP